MSEDIEDKIKEKYINFDEISVKFVAGNVRKYNIIIDLYIGKLKHYRLNFIYEWENKLTFDGNIDNIYKIIDRYIIKILGGEK